MLPQSYLYRIVKTLYKIAMQHSKYKLTQFTVVVVVVVATDVCKSYKAL